MIGTAIAAVLALTIGAAVYLTVNRSELPYPFNARPTASPSAPIRHGPPLRPGQPIDDRTLAKVSPDDFYFDLLRRQMTQPVGVVTSSLFLTPESFAHREPLEIYQVGIDHRTGADVHSKKSTVSITGYREGRPTSVTRCDRGTPYTYNLPASGYRPGWQVDTVGSCDLTKVRLGMPSSDGITPNGLSDRQATAYISALRTKDFSGFVVPQRPTVITTGGHRYIRQVVDFKPRKLADEYYWGDQIFIWAFRDAVGDVAEWPFMPDQFAGGQGLHAIYYIDPGTLLPTASKIRATALLDENGQPKEDPQQTNVVDYAFPKQLTPVTRKDHRPLHLTVPEGWKI
ncbi:hypothetical protein SAMN04489812_4761 [Microlunatus soli]|uniref:Uncharacterized protein n=1 Tax=Microlunatus soli TaxID=630515 RepID=A0A1H1YSY8_9ACTN|nr:hypothetical protein SAMN04489812_4761 [Microlunatus soli]